MSDRRRVDELLAMRAVEGLDPDGYRELDALLAAAPDTDADAYDLAAAALDQAMTTDEQPLPAHLRHRVLDAARAAGLVTEDKASRTRDAVQPPVAGGDVISLDGRRKPTSSSSWIPWLAAAAAALIAVAGWWPQTGPEPEQPVAERPAETTRPVEAAPTAAIENAPDVLVRSWSTTEDPTAAGASGEVVWSTDRQGGFMRISGLAPNDPSVEQYQLWIFDQAQDERYPIDGGVFDMPAGGTEVLVPIDAKIAVENPYLFAVTVEKPGGVVVSSRERITLLAEV